MTAHAITKEKYNLIPKDVFGFWIYIMSDCVLFATLFATYIVLHNNTMADLASKTLPACLTY